MPRFKLYLGNALALPEVTPNVILGDRVLDAGLDALRTEANEIWILTADPVDYPAAVSTKLGTAPVAFGAITASGSNRRIASAAITGGTVTTAGIADRWAVVDTVNSRLLASGALTGGTLTNTSYVWALGPIAILQPNA